MSLLGIHLAACTMLIVAGVAKARRPQDTATALAGWLPVAAHRLRMPVRVVAVAEALVGLVAIARPTPLPSALVAVSYTAFAAAVVVARRRGGALASCGCFGTPDTPATKAHVALDVVLAAACAAVAAAGSHQAIGPLLDAQPGNGVPLVLAATASAVLTLLVMTRLAVLQGVQLAIRQAP